MNIFDTITYYLDKFNAWANSNLNTNSLPKKKRTAKKKRVIKSGKFNK
jgi:hypothetical protein